MAHVHSRVAHVHSRVAVAYVQLTCETSHQSEILHSLIFVCIVNFTYIIVCIVNFTYIIVCNVNFTYIIVCIVNFTYIIVCIVNFTYLEIKANKKPIYFLSYASTLFHRNQFGY